MRFVLCLTVFHEARRASKPKIVGDQIFLDAPHPDKLALTEGTTKGMPILDHQRALEAETP